MNFYRKQEKEKTKQFLAKTKELNRFRSEPKMPVKVEYVSAFKKSNKQIPLTKSKNEMPRVRSKNSVYKQSKSPVRKSIHVIASGDTQIKSKNSSPSNQKVMKPGKSKIKVLKVLNDRSVSALSPRVKSSSSDMDTMRTPVVKSKLSFLYYKQSLDHIKTPPSIEKFDDANLSPFVDQKPTVILSFE